MDAAPHVYCFGSNMHGELGIGGMTSLTFVAPQQVLTAGTFVEVVAGYAFSCARRTDVTTGTVLCWGNNASGQTGSGDSSAVDPRHLSPVAVVGL
jgi:alpha-tubulin suppressor-like RCC1 family protein